MFRELFGSSNRRRHYHATVRGEDAHYDCYRTFPTEVIPFRQNGRARRQWRKEERMIRELREEREKPVNTILANRRAAYDEYHAKKAPASIYSRSELDTRSYRPAIGGYGKAEYNVYEDCVSDYPESSRDSRSHYSRSYRSTSNSSSILSSRKPRRHRAGLGSYLSCVMEYPQEEPSEPSTYRRHRRTDGYF